MKRMQRTLDAQALSVFCEQMLLLTEAVMPLHEGIHAMAASALFPAWMTGMVCAGEQSGQLERMLRELLAHFERAYQIRGAVVNAVRYPLTLLALVFRAAPVFAQAFCSLGVSGAPMRRLSQRVGINMLVLIALGVLGAAVRGGKWLKLRAWLLARSHAQKFASVLLASGFPMETALEMLPDVCDTEAEKQRVRICHQQLMEGETIFTAVGNLRLFEPLYLRILRVGLAAGQADGVEIYWSDASHAAFYLDAGSERRLCVEIERSVWEKASARRFCITRHALEDTTDWGTEARVTLIA